MIMPYSSDYVRKVKFKLLTAMEEHIFSDMGYKLFISNKMMSSDTYGGETNLTDRIVVVAIDLKLGRALSTLVHECLHVVYPKYRENTIEALGVAVYADMAPAEKSAVLKTLAAYAEWGE
jgi:hypothetical protein